MKYAIVLLIVFFTFCIDAFILYGGFYVVYVTDNSGWWWCLAALFSYGETETAYKIINSVLFGTKISKGVNYEITG